MGTGPEDLVDALTGLCADFPVAFSRDPAYVPACHHLPQLLLSLRDFPLLATLGWMETSALVVGRVHLIEQIRILMRERMSEDPVLEVLR